MQPAELPVIREQAGAAPATALPALSAEAGCGLGMIISTWGRTI